MKYIILCSKLVDYCNWDKHYEHNLLTDLLQDVRFLRVHADDRKNVNIFTRVPDQCTSNTVLGRSLHVCNLPTIHPENNSITAYNVNHWNIIIKK